MDPLDGGNNYIYSCFISQHWTVRNTYVEEYDDVVDDDNIGDHNVYKYVYDKTSYEEEEQENKHMEQCYEWWEHTVVQLVIL